MTNILWLFWKKVTFFGGKYGLLKGAWLALDEWHTAGKLDYFGNIS